MTTALPRASTVLAHSITAAAYVYDYFVKDHLGNTRVVLTEQTDFSQYMATMETQNAQTEDALFANVESTREAKPIDYPQDETTTPNTAVAKLNGSDPDKRVGPSIILKVMAGDTIQAAVRAFYRQQATTQNNAGVPAEDMAVSLMQALSLPMQAAASTHEASPQSRLAAPQGGITSSDLNDLKEKAPNTQREDKLKAYLNYVFFDNQFNFVEDGSGVKQVDSDPNQLETLSSGQVVAKKTGYVYVYTSNESQQDVLFDNMGVTQITGPVLEETHYYPFGLTMTGISSTAPLQIENRFKFNGKELNHKEFSDGAGLDWYSYGMREYDPQIGRFFRVDPITEKFYELSPYQYASDNPVAKIDLDGEEGIFFQEAYPYLIQKTIQNPEGWQAKTLGAASGVGGSILGAANGLAHPGAALKGLGKMLTQSPGENALNYGLNLYSQYSNSGSDALTDYAIYAHIFTDVALASSPLKGEGILAKGGTIAEAGEAVSLPNRLVRVIPASIDAKTLGRVGEADVFVTDAVELKGLKTSIDIAKKLTLKNSNGSLVKGPFRLLEFDTPEGLAQPYNRTNTGFINGGKTVGGATEYIIPNFDLDRLKNLTQTIVK